MAEKKFYVDLNLRGNQIKNVVVEKLVTAPENPVAGRIYYNTTVNKFFYYDGTNWVAGAEYQVANASESGVAVYDSTEGSTFKFRTLDGDEYISFSEKDGVITATFDFSKVEAAIDNAKSDLIGTSSDVKGADTIFGAKAFATDAAATAKSEVIGTNGDAWESTKTLWALKAEIESKNVDAEGDAYVSATASGNKVTVTASQQVKDAVAKAHEHSNKALLDTYTQTEADLADAVSKKHEHENKAELDLIQSGDVAKWNAKQDALAFDGDYNQATNKVALVSSITAAKNELKGDAATAVAGDATIAGAKKYADEAAEAAKGDIDEYTVNGQKISEGVVLDGGDIDLTGYTKPESTSPIAATDSVNDAIGKLEKGLEAAVAGGVNSIVEGNGIEVDATDSNNPKVSAKVAADDKILSVDANGLASGMIFKYDATARKIYLYGSAEDADHKIGEVDCDAFIKDGMLYGEQAFVADAATKTVTIKSQSHEFTGLTVGHQYLVFVFTDGAVTPTYSWDIIDLQDLVDVYTAGDGLQKNASDDHKFEVKVDANSEAFLTVGADGVKIAGVQDAIDAAEEAANDYTDQECAKKPNYYKDTVASGATGSKSIAVTTHKCGEAPMVQCFLGGSLVECGVAIDASGNVTVSWNGALDAAMTIVIIGL